MTISIRTDPETLFILQRIVLESSQELADNKAKKIEKSMKIELFGIINKRCFSYSSNPNGKPLKLTLKYYLADLVCRILSNVQSSFGVFEANKIEILKNQLHQQLI